MRALAKAHDIDEPGNPDLARRLQGQPLVVDITGTPHPRVIGFLDYLAIKGRAPKTIETYAQRLDTVLKHLGASGKHSLSLMVLTPTDIHFLREQIVGAPPFNGKPEAATWNLTVAALRSYFQWEKHHGELFVCDPSDARGARGTGDLE